MRDMQELNTSKYCPVYWPTLYRRLRYDLDLDLPALSAASGDEAIPPTSITNHSENTTPADSRLLQILFIVMSFYVLLFSCLHQVPIAEPLAVGSRSKCPPANAILLTLTIFHTSSILAPAPGPPHQLI